MGQLVIIGCGALKRPAPAPAGDLYIGPLFASAKRAALAVAAPADILILSALHGLRGLDEETEPYDLTIGQPGAITAGIVAQQAAERQLLWRPVVALCSRRYADICREVWSGVRAPLAGLGIGYQRHELAVIAQRGTV